MLGGDSATGSTEPAMAWAPSLRFPSPCGFEAGKQPPRLPPAHPPWQRARPGAAWPRGGAGEQRALGTRDISLHSREWIPHLVPAGMWSLSTCQWPQHTHSCSGANDANTLTPTNYPTRAPAGTCSMGHSHSTHVHTHRRMVYMHTHTCNWCTGTCALTHVQLVHTHMRLVHTHACAHT